MNNGSRYHAEVQVSLEGRPARVNVFADTLEEIFLDLANVCAQFPPDWKSPAHREIANAQLLDRQRKAAAPGAPPRKTPTPSGTTSAETDELPVCEQCGSWDGMELIKFTDKKTGQRRQAWKCQTCEKWHFPPNGKK